MVEWMIDEWRDGWMGRLRNLKQHDELQNDIMNTHFQPWKLSGMDFRLQKIDTMATGGDILGPKTSDKLSYHTINFSDAADSAASQHA